LYSQRESKRRTGEVFFVQPKRIEEAYRTGILCRAKDYRKGVGEVLFVQPKRIKEKYQRVHPKRIEEVYRRGIFLYSKRESKRHT
jgi:hypothetical protein